MKKINLPTKITIARIVMATLLILAMIVFYLIDQFNAGFIRQANIYLTGDRLVYINGYMLGFFGLFILASFSDFLDGYLARKNNEVTDLGKFLDPLADKMLINALMIFLAINFMSLGDSVKFPFFCVIIMTIRDLIVDGMRLMAAKKQIVVAANIYGKIKTVTQMLAIAVVLLNGFPFAFFDNSWPAYLHVSDLLCYIATFFSVLSGVIYLKQNIGYVLGGKENE